MMTLAMLVAASLSASSGLGWLSGYWLSCEDGIEVSETWNPPTGNVMRGSSMTVAADGKTKFDVMRIGPGRRGVTFFAEPSGQPPAEFALKESGENHVTFENLKHDFPQRIVYRREGDRLDARIEGRSAAGAKERNWHYSAAPLNSNCPKATTTPETDGATVPLQATPEGDIAEKSPEPKPEADQPETIDAAPTLEVPPDAKPSPKTGGSLMGPVDEPM